MKPKPKSTFAVAHRASSPSEAEIVRSLLEGEEIYAVIPDRNVPLPLDQSPFDGEYNPSGCDVFVRAADVEKAKRVIADARAAAQRGDDAEEADEDDDDDDDE